MSTRTTNIILLVFIALAVAAGAWAYPQLPAQVASHWGAAGNVNGYMSRFWGVFLIPLLMLVMFAIYLVIPRIDPMHSNIASFRAHFNAFWVVLFAFLLYLDKLVLWWNLGHRFNLTFAIIPAVAVLIFFIGIFLQRSKRNWFFGIRTPWTLSSDAVWERTNRVGGKLFELAAVIILFGMLFPNALVWFIVVPIAATALFSVVYSYVVFRKLGK